jgi:YbbR domain-containing protein
VKKNPWIKVAAVLLAMGLWMFVISRGQSQVSLEAPVEFRNVPSGLQIVGESSKTVTLSIRGHERFIRTLSPEDVYVSLDASDLKRGIQRYSITRGDVRLPSTLRVETVSPSAVNVQAGKTLKRKVPVRPLVVGSPLEGYRIGTVEVVPEEITVEGLVNEVRRLQALETEPVDVSSASATVVSETRVRKPGGAVRLEVDAVTVRVVIMKEKG